MTTMRARGDGIALVEQCYALEGTMDEWLARVTHAAEPLVDRGFGAQSAIYRWPGPGGLDLVAESYGRTPEWVPAFIRRASSEIPGEAREHQIKTSPPVQTARQMMEMYASGTDFYPALSPPGVVVRDHVAIVARDGSDHMLMVGALAEQELHLSRAERARFGRLSWHIAAGWRLMRRLASASPAEAVLEPDGRIAHAEAAAKGRDARATLRAAVEAMDRARGPLRRSAPDEALELWRGLVAGRWSLVDRFDSDGRRFVVARRNDPEFPDPRGLTMRERQCTRLAAQGRSNSEIGYALGLSSSTVGTHVVRAMRKLGVRRRAQLSDHLDPAPLAGDVRMQRLAGEDDELCALSTPTMTLPSDSPLTDSELEVVRCALDGASNQEIARRRGSSERTIANQLQSIYRKLGVHSRSELLQHLRAGRPRGEDDPASRAG